MMKVSIIVTCYNHEKFIRQCVESIFNQTYRNIQLIIINDGSTDQSAEIIESLLITDPFKDTIFVNQENLGACASRNKGLELATGDYILFVDSDNFLDIKHVEKSINSLESTKSDIAYCSLKDASSNNIINEVPSFSLEKLLSVNFIDTCSLFRKKVLGEIRFDMGLNRKSMQDYDFFLNMVLNGAKPVKVENLYINYRIIENSQGNRGESYAQRKEWIDTYKYILNKHPEHSNTTTMIIGTWYEQLYTDYMNEVQNKEELKKQYDSLFLENSNKIKELESKSKILETESKSLAIKYESLDRLYLSIVHSSSWKYGRLLTYPFRKIKTKMINHKNKSNTLEFTNENYGEWIRKIEQNDSKAADPLEELSYCPKLSILIPVYNVEPKWLKKCVESIMNQTYKNWEICIADDASTNKGTIEQLKKLEMLSDKIHIVYRNKNGHISEATNSALQVATGEYIVLMDNDDELASNALMEVISLLNKHKDANLIYSDEDKIDENGNRFDPHFKPNWSPDLILNQNYVSHLGVYRASIAKNINGFRKGYEGAQDHDFLLRFVENISEDTIYHIPKVLYHWRALKGSTALDINEKDYVGERGLLAIKDALKRRKREASVSLGKYPGLYDISYKIIDHPLVSIIIPTKNGYDDVKKCIDSIIEKSSYKNYEIILADNGSDDPKMNDLYDLYKKRLGERFSCVVIDIPFNYSKINNLAAQEASGKFLLFLNNDTSVITKTWIQEMLGFAQYPEYGCVGAKLWYFDDTIQHGGVVLGVGGVAGHAFLNATKEQPGYFSRLYTDYNYTAVTAACLMVRKNIFEQVNGFDETFEVAFNDVDLCIRIYELGKRNVWAHKAELYHFESKSRGYEDTPEKQERFKGEIERMKRTHREILENDPAYNPNFDLNSNPFSTLKTKV